MEELVDWLLVEELVVVLLEVGEEVVVSEVELEEALVAEDTLVEELELGVVEDDCDEAVVVEEGALLVDVASPSEDVVNAVVWV